MIKNGIGGMIKFDYTPTFTNNAVAAVYHNYSLSTTGSISEGDITFGAQSHAELSEQLFYIDGDVLGYENNFVVMRNDVAQLNSAEPICTKPLNGFAELHGSIFEKTNQNIYAPVLKYELFDAGSKFSYGERDVIDGKFDIVGINPNKYTITVTDPTRKYNGKIIDIEVTEDQINTDLIKPKIILGTSSSTYYNGLTRLFEQTITLVNCLGGESATLNISNRPSWLNLVKIDNETYIARGNPPPELYEFDSELGSYKTLTIEYNLLDYRQNNVLTDTISKTYDFETKCSFNLFNTLDNQNYTYVGPVELISYNGMSGINVNGKNKTIKMLNNANITQKTSNFTMMFSFTVLSLDNPVTKNNLFVGDTTTNSNNRFWIGTSSQNNTYTSPKLSIYFGSGSELQTTTTIQENRTYNVKIVRHNSTTSVYVNGSRSGFWNVNTAFGSLDRTVMFGDGGWGNYSSNIIIHEYNYIADYSDIMNIIDFKSNKNQITFMKYYRYYIFSFDTQPIKMYSIHNSNPTKIDYFINPYGIKFTDNGVYENVNILPDNALNTYTISFDVTSVSNINEIVMFQIGCLRITTKDDLVNIYVNDTLEISRTLTSIGSKTNFDIIYDGVNLILYNDGFIITSIVPKNSAQLYGNRINFGYDGKDTTLLTPYIIHNIKIVEGVRYIGDHLYDYTTDANIISDTVSYVGAVEYNSKIEYSPDDIDIKTIDSTIQIDGISNVTYGEIGGSLAWIFNNPLDYVTFSDERFKLFAGFDMTFDFYWSGVRTDNKNVSIVSSKNTISDTTWTTDMFAIRTDGTGSTPRVHASFGGRFSVTSPTNGTLNVGWNTIRVYRMRENHLYLAVNGRESGSSGYYNNIKFGQLGQLEFGYSYSKFGMTQCGIKNFILKVINF